MLLEGSNEAVDEEAGIQVSGGKAPRTCGNAHAVAFPLNTASSTPSMIQKVATPRANKEFSQTSALSTREKKVLISPIIGEAARGVFRSPILADTSSPKLNS
jgi:hypothetical protein